MTDATEHAGAKAKALDALVALFIRALAYPAAYPALQERRERYARAQASALLEVLIELAANEAERRAAPWLKEREREVEQLTEANLDLQENLATARAQADGARELAEGLRRTVEELLGRVAALEAARG